MPDLSDLLGDVYGGSAQGANPDGPPVVEEPAAADRPAPRVPEWAGDDRLDEAFGDWTPGPPPDAPRAEREVMTEAAPPSRPAPLDDDLAAALSAALAAAPPHEDVAPPVAPVTPAASTAPIAAAATADPAPVATLAPTAPPAAALPPLPDPPPAPPLGSFSRSAGSLFGQVAAPAVEPKPPAPASDAVAAETPPAAVAGLATRWQRSHDDILPRGARANRGLRVR